MDIDKIEKEIKDKNLTGKRISKEDIESVIAKEEYHIFPDSQVTVCCLTLKNGFNTIGESACVDPENFNKELGEQIARGKAFQEIWKLEAYLLKQQIFEAE